MTFIPAVILLLFHLCIAFLPIGYSRALNPANCLYQCNPSIFGPDFNSWYLNYVGYDLAGDIVGCDYGSTETISCSLNLTTGLDPLLPDYHNYYCPISGTLCCAPSIPSGASCDIIFGCFLNNPLGSNLTESTPDLTSNTLACTYNASVPPCVYDLTTGCLLEQQGIFECYGQLSSECVPTGISSTSTSFPVSSTTLIPTTSTITIPPSTTSPTTSNSASSTTLSISTTSTGILPPSSTPPADSSWALRYGCAQDNPSRILSRVVGYTLANNTPASCTIICASGNYEWAGVEYGNECFCGTSVVTNGEYPTSIDASNCTMSCAGDSSQTCGGSWAMQIYQWDNLSGAEAQYDVPTNWVSWNNVEDGENCFVDDAQRVLPNATSTTLTNNGPGTCISFCASKNYTLAGLEYGDECWCGVNYPGWSGPNSTATYTCDTPCPEAPNLDCGGSWSMKLYYQDA